MSAELEDRLGHLVGGAVPPPEPTDGLRGRIARRRRRRRAIGGGALAVVAVVSGLLALSTRSDDGRVRTVDRPPAGSWVVPDVIGMSFAEARVRLGQAEVFGVVHSGDAGDWFATVVATEPAAGSLVSKRERVVLRTALPAPPAAVVCPGYPTADLPGGVDSADARPNISGVTLQASRRAIPSVRDVIPTPKAPIYVARGVVRPWDRVDGRIVVPDDPGYQVVVDVGVTGTCPTYPGGTSVQGSMVTYVRDWPSGDEGTVLGTDHLWPRRAGIDDPMLTARGFVASMLSGGSVVADDDSFDGPTWFTLRSDVTNVRILLIPTEHGWVVQQVGTPSLVFGAKDVHVAAPDPEVRTTSLIIGYGDRTESSVAAGPGGTDLDVELRGTVHTYLLLLFDDHDRLLAASGAVR